MASQWYTRERSSKGGEAWLLTPAAVKGGATRMAFEVGDFQDLIRLLREHPDWRDELRTLLLTQELLTLPALARELAERVAQLAGGQQQLTERVAQLTQTVALLAEGQRRHEERLDRLTEGQQRLTVQMGEVRGWTLEQRYRTHAPAYFGRFLRQVQLVDVGRLVEALRERLAEGELAELLLTDLILTGHLPTPAGSSEVWVVLEVSATVDRRDVERAQRRAALLRQVRYPTVAVAASTEATAGAQQAASEEGVALLRDGRIDGWQEALDHMRAEGETGH
jgi:hypothetical protein